MEEAGDGETRTYDGGPDAWSETASISTRITKERERVFGSRWEDARCIRSGGGGNGGSISVVKLQCSAGRGKYKVKRRVNEARKKDLGNPDNAEKGKRRS